jgi:sugar O-acyltransferase (sialic acid O-acetyltransferase NeuD family)
MKKRIALIGSGELARHIAHYLDEDSQFETVGFFDDFTEKGTLVGNHTVMGRLNDIENSFKNGLFDELIVAVGYTRMKYRKQVFERFEKTVPFATFLHASSFVDFSAKIGKGVVIFPSCTIYQDSVIEDNVFIQIGSVMADLIIKKHTMISPSASIAGHCIIGECCNIGVSTIIINDVSICDFVRTGGGTVVTKNITEPGLYVGVPARKIKDEY